MLHIKLQDILCGVFYVVRLKKNTILIKQKYLEINIVI